MSSPGKRNNNILGRRLKRLRLAAGLTQNQLALELGVTRRAIDYYEREGHDPPTNLLFALAKILDVTLEELLGIKSIEDRPPRLGSQLLRRFRQIEKLSPKVKILVLKLLDTLIEAEQFKEK